MNLSDTTVSVVLPVHMGVPPAQFQAALESVLTQSRPADEILIIEDGPLSAAHHAVASVASEKHPNLVIIQFATNQGAGVANQAGLNAARGEWIAKVDADDICLPERFQRQLTAVRAVGADVCGASMGEFDENPNRILGVRSNPARHKSIARRMRYNNPINHPTSMYRRDMALSVGGYSSLRFMQDYDLFARMLAAGAVMMNLDDVLVLFRADDSMFRRRTAPEMTQCEFDLQRTLVRVGLIGKFARCRNLILRLGFRRLPLSVLRPLYRTMFRRKRSRLALDPGSGS